MKLKNLFTIAVAATLFNACSADYLDTLPSRPPIREPYLRQQKMHAWQLTDFAS